jgi:hypothetical protein
MLMTFMINNLEHFTFNCASHNKLTRHRGNLHVLQSHLSLTEKGVHYMSVKTFKTSPEFLVGSVGDENQFRGKLKEILLFNSFYSVENVLIIVKIYRQETHGIGLGNTYTC